MLAATILLISSCLGQESLVDLERTDEAFYGGDVRDNLVLEEEVFDDDQPGVCGLKTCSQYVTGRYLSYAKALKIIQNEEFLNSVEGGAAVASRRNFQRRRQSVKTPPPSVEMGNLRQRTIKRRGRWKRQM